jgi:hypothetical protein
MTIYVTWRDFLLRKGAIANVLANLGSSDSGYSYFRRERMKNEEVKWVVIPFWLALAAIGLWVAHL